MTFAHWKNKLVHMSRLLDPLASSDHVRGDGREEVAMHFIVDIPEETTKDDVIAKLVAKLLTSGRDRVEDTDGLAFEEEWPPSVLSQFEVNLDPSKRWAWQSLK